MTTTITITDTETTITTTKDLAVQLISKNPNAFTKINDDVYTLIYDNDYVQTISSILKYKR
jgi:hypothetical protein